MRKLCSKLHLWLSIPFGLIITIICFTGAFLVFEQQIMEITRPQLYFVKETGATTLSAARIVDIVAQGLPDSVAVKGITIASDPRRTWQVSLSQPRRTSVNVNPYTGQITGRSERTAFFMCMFKMHRWLLDSANPGGIFWGKLVVGISTLLFIFVLLTGMVIWIPRTRQTMKNRLKITINKGWRRFWYDLHVSAGIYATALLLIMALTGLTWSFPWYRSGFYKLLGVETTAPTHSAPSSGRQERNHRQKQGGHSPNFGPWDYVYQTLATHYPDYTRISISKGTATVATHGWGNQRATDNCKFDPHTGEITELVRYQDSERSSKLRGWIYSLHVGNWGGLFSQIISVLAALIGASLPLTGYYFWIRRLRRKN